MLEQIAKLIDAFEHAGFAKVVDGEGDRTAVWQCHRLFGKIDADLRCRILFDEALNLLVRVFIDNDGQQAIFQGVVAENIGEPNIIKITIAEIGTTTNAGESQPSKRPVDPLPNKKC